MAPTRKYQGSRSPGFAATSLSELERDGTGMWGRRSRARAGPSGRDRRMAIQVYRNWAEHEPKAGAPPWETRALIAPACLGEHCVGGCLADRDSRITISHVGARFARLLDAPTEDFDAELYPAAVVIGIFAQLRERLAGFLGPHFGEGGFPTSDFETIHYRLVLLPFGGGGPWDGGHWMGLANGKPGDYRRRMGREP